MKSSSLRPFIHPGAVAKSQEAQDGSRTAKKIVVFASFHLCTHKHSNRQTKGNLDEQIEGRNTFCKLKTLMFSSPVLITYASQKLYSLHPSATGTGVEARQRICCCRRDNFNQDVQLEDDDTYFETSARWAVENLKKRTLPHISPRRGNTYYNRKAGNPIQSFQI